MTVILASTPHFANPKKLGGCGVWHEQRHDPLDGADFQLAFGQAQDRPSRQGGFEVLLGIAGVTAAACVPATGPHENPALDLDQRAASQVCEIGTPFPRWVEPEFALKGWSLRNPPKQVES